MREIPSLHRDAQRLGRQLQPDLDSAVQRVRQLAAGEQSSPRGGRIRLLALPGLAALLAGVVLPGALSPSRPAQVDGLRRAPVGLHQASYIGGPLLTAPPVPVTTGGAIPDCAVASVTVELVLDRPEYAGAAPVGLAMVLRNAGRATCSAAVDSCASWVRVSSGTEVVYDSSADPRLACGVTPGATGHLTYLPRVQLSPGQVAALHFNWTRAGCANLATNPDCGRLRELGHGGGTTTLTLEGAWAGFPVTDYRLHALPRHLDEVLTANSPISHSSNVWSM